MALGHRTAGAGGGGGDCCRRPRLTAVFVDVGAGTTINARPQRAGHRPLQRPIWSPGSPSDAAAAAMS